MELSDSLKDFLYSPLMIGVQVFSGIFAIGLFLLYARMLKDTGWARRLEESKVSLEQENETDNEEEVAQSQSSDMSFFTERWNVVVSRMQSPEEAQWKLAIIEADTLVDYTIQQMGVQGETMGERMKNLNRSSFPLLDSAWKAHRVRNYIAHDPSYQVSAQTAARVFDLYRRIFTRLGFINNP